MYNYGCKNIPTSYPRIETVACFDVYHVACCVSVEAGSGLGDYSDM